MRILFKKTTLRKNYNKKKKNIGNIRRNILIILITKSRIRKIKKLQIKKMITNHKINNINNIKNINKNIIMWNKIESDNKTDNIIHNFQNNKNFKYKNTYINDIEIIVNLKLTKMIQ